ncbi:MAG TPA: hypothetical protein VM389_08540 [Phycisphaerae bacterium]|nr:hypothetical protein [Phycisphaerae bacterium]
MRRIAIWFGLGMVAVAAVSGCATSGLTSTPPLGEPTSPAALHSPAEAGTGNVWLDTYAHPARPEGTQAGEGEGF